MIKEGFKIPDFTLDVTDGAKISLKDLKGKWTVLYFYPKDSTPGCTTEACNFRDSYAGYKKLGAQIIGVSADSVESHGKFASKYELPFPLIADTEKVLIDAFGVMKEKNMYGKKFMGIVRSTFIINPEGVVDKVFGSVKADTHDGEVLEYLSEKLA